jgi:hypothetical protein
MRDFEYKGAAEMPYNPSDYGLPLWRDEDHQPSVKAEEPQTNNSVSAEAAKEKLCAWAMSQVGYSEGANNSNRYADTPGLSEMYGWAPQNQPWCDVFVDSGFIICFGLAAACAMTYQRMGEGSALCRQSAQYYKDNGAFFQTPEIGDQAFFFSSGGINHTGIVVRVDGGSVHTVEGNVSDMVAERCYSVGDSKIAGYGRPNWEAVEGKDLPATTNEPIANDTAEKAEPKHYELRFPYLQNGDTGDAVWVVQTLLQARNIYCGPWGADGDFGNGTEKAVKDFQRRHNLTIDGVVGPETGAALLGGEVFTIKQAEPKAESVLQSVLTKIRERRAAFS